MGAKQSSESDPARPAPSSGRATPDSAAATAAKSKLIKGKSKDQNNLLTAHQKRLLRQAWKHMNKNMGNMVFRRMVSKDPEIAKIFQRAVTDRGVLQLSMTPISAQQHHSALFFDVLELAMQDLDSLDNLAAKCYEYGAKHAQYKDIGFKLEHWDLWGEALTEAAREWEGWRTHREALRGWTRLISLMVDRFRAGHQQAQRKNAQKYESEGLTRNMSEDISGTDDQRQCKSATPSSSNVSLQKQHSSSSFTCRPKVSYNDNTTTIQE